MPVAALGALLGGLLGKAILGTPKTYGADPSVPGISSATIKKGGKGQPDITVPQVDPTEAIHYFRAAADVQEAYFEKGLEFYNDALTAAGREIQASYAEAKAELAPAARAGVAALNEQLRFMGIEPIQATAGMADRLSGIGEFPELQDQMARAESLSDPRDRRAAKEQVLSEFEALQGQEMPEDTRQRLAALSDEYSREYTEERQRAYTGAEVSEQIAATPGYQFQLEQGTKAIERQGAAAGMLGSGKTLHALQEYGQQLGMGFFQQHLSNLAGVAQHGMQATMQRSAYDVSRGQDIATMLERGGAVGRETSGLIGQAKGDSHIQSGQAALQAAMRNAELQMQGIMQGRSIEAGQRQQAIASGPGYMQAQTQRGLAVAQGTAGLGLMRPAQVAPSSVYQYGAGGAVTGYIQPGIKV